MNSSDVQEWFDTYLDTFAAFGRGDRDDIDDLLRYYDVPLLLATDAGALALNSKDSVAHALQEQIDGMRAANYARSEVLESRVEILNGVSALYRAHFSRRRSDRSEIGRLRVTYLLTDRAAGRRIAALVVHSAKPLSRGGDCCLRQERYRRRQPNAIGPGKLGSTGIMSPAGQRDRIDGRRSCDV